MQVLPNTSGKIDTALGKYLNDIDKIPNMSFTRKLDSACHFNLSLTLEPKNAKCSKPVLSGQTDKTKDLKKSGSSFKVDCIAECSLGTFCNSFGLH